MSTQYAVDDVAFDFQSKSIIAPPPGPTIIPVTTNQFSIDDIALDFNSEAPVIVPAGVPVVVGNDKMCATTPTGQVCIPAFTFTEIAFAPDVTATKAALNLKAANALTYTTHNLVIPDHGTYSLGALQQAKIVLSASGLNGNISQVLCAFVVNVPSPDIISNVGVMVQSPAGLTTLAMFGNWGSNSTGVSNFIFGDIYQVSANFGLAHGQTTVFGAFRPFPLNNTTNWQPPAPQQPYGTTFSALNGTSPNGSWTVWLQNFLGAGGVPMVFSNVSLYITSA